MAAGTYFDGELARGHAVSVDVDTVLRIEGDGVSRQLALADVRISDRIGDVPRFLYLPDGATVETPDNAAIDAALAAQRRSRFAQLIHGLESRQWIAVTGCLVLLALIAALAFYGPPVLARSVASRVPPEVEARIGAASLQAIRPYFGESELTAGEQARVERQLARLQQDPSVPRARLEFRQMNGGLANAFALPGNVIVVTDALVRLPASDDELAAVLAHELGHLKLRHGDQDLLRKSFALLIVAAVTGDMSTLTSFASTLPITILTAGYSRDLEREADAYAHQLLRSRGINVHAFATVLVKLDAEYASLPRTATYLSTHPATEERIALFGGITPAERKVVLAQRWLDRAATALKRIDYAGAITDYTHAIEINPTAPSYTQRAEARYKNGDKVGAMVDIAQARQLDPKLPDAAALRVEVLALGLDRYQDALIAANDGLLVAPNNARILATRGFAESMLGNAGAASADLERAVALAPKESLGWALRALFEARNRKFADARADFDVALRLAPDAEWVRVNRALLLEQQNDNAAALRDFEAIEDPAQKTPLYYYGRGVAEWHLNAPDQAIADLGHALKDRAPTKLTLHALCARATLYTQTGEYSLAIADCDAAIALAPRSYDACYLRAIAQFDLGKFKDALASLDRATTVGGDAARILDQRADVLWEMGDYPAALATVNQLLKLDTSARIYLDRGLIEFSMERWTAAEADLDNAISHSPDGLHKQYAVMYRLLARRQADADDEPYEYRMEVAGWPEGWAKSVGEYLAGRITEAQLRAAVYAGNGPSVAGRVCEADFYVAMTHLLAGDAATAAELFRKCRATGMRDYYEYKLAGTQLRRLHARGVLPPDSDILGAVEAAQEARQRARGKK